MSMIFRRDYNAFRNYVEDILPKISRGNKPSIVTHKLYDINDPIYNELQRLRLNNEEENKVKVVYAPVYIGQDIIFNLPKEKILPGFDLGLFLSRYEPFGYTALESLYFGVPIILSNRTGFAKSIEKNNIKSDYICLVDVKNLESEKEKILNFVERLSSLDTSEFLKVREELYDVSKYYDWKSRIEEYLSLYES